MTFFSKKTTLTMLGILLSLTINAQFDKSSGTDKKGKKKAIFKAEEKTVKKPEAIKVDPTNGFKNAYKEIKKSQKEEEDLKNKGILTKAMINEARALNNLNRINGMFKYPVIDQDLGSFRTESKSVTIICRDFQYPDGDRVTIFVNDIPAVTNIILKRAYQSFTIPLDVGLNKIAFVALNQGTSGPNTAGFRVYNDSGSLLSANEWNLATGAKATLAIARSK